MRFVELAKKNFKAIFFGGLSLSLGVLTIGCAAQATVYQPVNSLFSVTEVISNREHPYWEWIYNLQGRVARNGQQSASVWSLRAQSHTGLIVSAMHTLGEGYLGLGGSLIEERLRDPRDQPGATRIFLVKDDTGSVDSLASVLFILYNPEVPPEQSGNYLLDILPRNDFFVGIIDSQKVSMEPFPVEPEPLKNEAPAIIDPSGLTTIEPTYAAVNAGETVVLMGYPQAGDFAGKLTASTGLVLSDGEAKEVIKKLAILGDEEGGIDYDPEAEIIIEGYAVKGMSGGGVYNRDGKQAGIMVRASNEYEGKQYVRAVKMTYVVGRLSSALESLSSTDMARFSQYLEPLS